MKKKETIITYLLLFIVLIAIGVGTFISGIGETIANITTAVVAIISAIAVYVQMKKDKQTSQAEFLLEFAKYFYVFKGVREVEGLIDRSVELGKSFQYEEKYFDGILNYLVWLEGLGGIVQNGTITIELIDNLFNYRFFTMVNSKSVQERELARFPEYYRGLYWLHKNWTEYRKANGEDIYFEEESLSKVARYDEMCKK